MIKLSDYVIKFVEKLGIKDVFLLPGGGCMHLVDSLGQNKKIQKITVLHEQAAAIGADAYSQYTGKPGVVLVTTGPGGTNALTGTAASWIDSTPVLVISGHERCGLPLMCSGFSFVTLTRISLWKMLLIISANSLTDIS